MCAMNILVVDDEENCRIALEDLLVRRGFWVETASDGEQALKKLEQNQYDILITDLKMPGITGLELVQFVRENNPVTKVIIMTSCQSGEIELMACDKSANLYLNKPLDLRILCDYLSKQVIRTDIVGNKNEKWRNHRPSMEGTETL